jgi:hypothetical protein
VRKRSRRLGGEKEGGRGLSTRVIVGRQGRHAGGLSVWSCLFEQLGFGRCWLGLSTAPVLLLAHIEAVGTD